MDEDKRHKTEITIETISVTTIRTRGAGRNEIYCHYCGQNVPPLDAAKAISILGLDLFPPGGAFHHEVLHRLTETDVCGNSLAMYVDNRNLEGQRPVTEKPDRNKEP